MPQCEEADIGQNVFEFPKEEDHTDEKQHMVNSRHHVLGAEIQKRNGRNARYGFDISGISGRYVMCKRRNAGPKKADQ